MCIFEKLFLTKQRRNKKVSQYCQGTDSLVSLFLQQQSLFSITTMEITNHIRCFFLSGQAYKDDYYEFSDDLASRPLPRIISRGETIRAAVGEKINLPCHVENLGKNCPIFRCIYEPFLIRPNWHLLSDITAN